MPSLYLSLVALALTLAFFWVRHQDPRLLRGLALALSLLAIYFLYDRLRPESVAEQIQRKTEAMAQAVAARDLDGILEHVSDQFETDRHDKASLRARAERALADGDLTRLEVWNFANAQVEDATARIDFIVKVYTSQGEVPYNCTATFVKDPDGQWRLRGFQLFSLFDRRHQVPIGSP
jgi:hypothetical protein